MAGNIKYMPFITDEELQKNSKTQTFKKEPSKKEPTMLQNIGDSLKGRGEKIVSDTKEMAGGKINPVEFGVRNIGNVIGGVGDIFGDIVSPVIKKPLEKAFSTPIGQDLAHAITLGYDTYNKIKNSSPEALRIAKDVEGVINIAGLFPASKAVQTGTKTLLKTGKVIGNTSKESLLKISSNLKNNTKKITSDLANSNFISPIEPGVRNEFGKTTKNELSKYLTVAERGALDYSKPSALDVVGEVAADATKKLKNFMGTYGKHIGNIPKLQANIDLQKEVLASTDKFKSLLKDRAGLIINKKGGISTMAGRLGKLTNEELKLVSFVNDKLQKLSKTPNYQAVDDFVNSVQKELFDKTSNMLIAKNSNAGAIAKEITSTINKSFKNIGDSSKRMTYSNLKYSEIADTFNTLNKLLGANGKNAGALMKRVFSPHDAGTKKLFENVKKITGIDLIKEATLAKYAMEKIGDARSASLLEQMNMLRGGGAIGLIEKAANLMLNKSKDPFKAAEKYLKK